jgi:4-alpha-glucanotransferase
MAAGQQSPYSAMSAMAIDPIFIRVDRCAGIRRARR